MRQLLTLPRITTSVGLTDKGEVGSSSLPPWFVQNYEGLCRHRRPVFICLRRPPPTLTVADRRWARHILPHETPSNGRIVPPEATPAPPGNCKPRSESRLSRLVAVTLALLASTACSPEGDDTPFPNRPIEIVSWATPRSPSDLPSGALADAAPPHFDGQRVNVMTRQGGAGAVGIQYMQGRAAGPPCARHVHG